MRTAAAVCNVALLVIVGSVVLTEGLPRQAGYLILTLLMLFVPLVSALVLSERRRPVHRLRRWDRLLVVCNLVTLAVACWETVAQYPYREGNSILVFAAFTIGTPLLTLLVLLVPRRSAPPAAA